MIRIDRIRIMALRAAIHTGRTVWNVIVGVALIIGLLSGALAIANAAGATQTTVKNIIELPANLDSWLEITEAAAAKYVAEE